MVKDRAARPAGSTGRTQGRHAGLSRDRVLRAAVDLIDAEGLAALSMRRLARSLGVEAMTLYHHVKSKAALEDAVVEHVMTEAFASLDPEGPWQDVLAAYAMALHRGLASHPRTAPLFARRPAMTPRSLEQIEALLRVLTRAGFEAATALTIVRATGASVLGQHLGYDAEPSGTDASGPGRTESADERDGAAEFDLVAQALEVGLAGPEELVRFTVTSLVAGFERLL